VPYRPEPRRDEATETLEVKTGVLLNDVSFMPHKRKSHYYGEVVNAQLLFPSPDLLEALGSPRPTVGISYAAMENGISVFYVGLNWDLYLTRRTYFSAGLGGSVNNAKRLRDADPQEYQAVGCRYLFHFSAGLGFRMTNEVSVELYSNHASNAHLCSPDGAVEATGLRFGKRF
jgi:hypothetical protein